MSRCHHHQLMPSSMVVGCSVYSVELQEAMKSMVSRTRRGLIKVQIVITLDPDQERHRDHNLLIAAKRIGS